MRNLILIFVLLALVGCRSKKKLVEREEVKIETTLNKAILETIISDSTASTKSEIFVVKSSENVSGDIIDGSATIEKKTVGDATVWKVSGMKNIKISNASENTTSRDTSSIALSKKENTKTSIEETSVTESKKRNTDSEVKTFPTMIAFGIGLGVVALGVFLYIRYKKRQVIG